MMPSPFPGIDPYLEPVLWRDLHGRFIVYAAESLQLQLPSRYRAEITERLVFAAGQRHIEPDVAIVRQRMVREAATVTYGSPPVATEFDEPVVFPAPVEDVFESYIEITDLTSDRVVTSIELLSPTNKVPGQGRDSYLRKQDELIRAGANLVEIDLLRGGQRTVASGLTLSCYEPCYSVIAVWRVASQCHEAYFVQLDRRLPCIRIPLLPEDNDVGLDVQAVFTRCYDAARYDLRIDYRNEPQVVLSAKDLAWMVEHLRTCNLRT